MKWSVYLTFLNHRKFNITITLLNNNLKLHYCRFEKLPISSTSCEKQYVFHIKTHFCVCVKRITLCNCLCSSSPSSPSPRSSRDFASVVGNIEKFGAKTILQTTKQLIQFVVLEIQFRSLKYMTVISIRKNLSNISFLSNR